LFQYQGKNESVKAMYQAQIEQQDGQPKRNSVVLDIETNAKSIKERFEKGDDLVNGSEKNAKEVPDLELFTAGESHVLISLQTSDITATSALIA
jgi:hypothetical protein